MRTRSALAGLGLTATFMAAAALPAAAASSYITHPGVTGELELAGRILVDDTACDDDSVYAQWKTYGGQVQKITNTSGCRAGASAGNVPMGKGTDIYWRVCVDKSWPTSDSCSAWKVDRLWWP
ncbi:hypothetical protein OG394_12975 [Kribbella sp. NBC_01245]|uniref:hypothetical protein n=1 Tax=Kribbella sp. NBC_01245 TaxID=2903578 RepID=UPI002E2C7C1C|nr:hypothetical protein [Kribbella sp. NBC_01245]